MPGFLDRFDQGKENDTSVLQEGFFLQTSAALVHYNRVWFACHVLHLA